MQLSDNSPWMFRYHPIRLALTTVLAVGLGSGAALAQSITPANDGTGTVVLPNGAVYVITGGSLSGNGANLFHSFAQFGLSTAETANFLADPTIQNIVGRVTGGSVSSIDGLLQVSGGNANLYLLNPAGILFGPNAALNLGGSFTAATATGLEFDDQWLPSLGTASYEALMGDPTGFAFTAADGANALVNAGDLGVPPGQTLTLLGGSVINTGALTAPGGQIVIMAVPGEHLVRIYPVGGVLGVELATLPETQASAAAATAFSPLDLPSLLRGGDPAISTALVQQPDGRLSLTEAGLGEARIAGRIDATAEVGGSIYILGDVVNLEAASIDASGTMGGGTVLVGGGYQGEGPVPNAAHTRVDANTVVTANANEQGDGGQVVIWANDSTAFEGIISAQGGARSGNGGEVEVSGRRQLAFTGSVDVTAPSGDWGTLLLDPETITIVDREVGDADEQLPTIDGEDEPGAAFTLSAEALENLAASADIVLEASKDILIEDLADDALSFEAGPGGAITFIADADNNGEGQFRFADINDVIEAPGRNLTIQAGSLVIGEIDTSPLEIPDFPDAPVSGGSVTLVATRGEIIAGDVTTASSTGSGGNITLEAAKTITADFLNSSSAESDGGNQQLFADGDIQVETLDAQGGSEGSGGDIAIEANGNITVGDVTTASSGGSGGNITLEAATTISADFLDSSSAESDGGDQQLFANGDIQVEALDAQGGSEGSGGNIAIETDQNFRALGSFIDEAGLETSLSSRGGLGGGSISITYGRPRFTVGDPSNNGTQAAISTGDATLNPGSPIADGGRVVGEGLSGEIRLLQARGNRAIEGQFNGAQPLPPLPPSPPPPQPDGPGGEQSTLSHAGQRLPEDRLQASEESPARDFSNYFGELIRPPQPVSLEQARATLQSIQAQTGEVPAFVSVRFSPPSETTLSNDLPQSNDVVLELLLITGNGEPMLVTVFDASRQNLLREQERLRRQVTNPSLTDGDGYLSPAQTLYQWLIAPIESELTEQGVTNIGFILDAGLRTLPIAALHDGEQFLVEKYSVGLIPSIGLIDSSYVNISRQNSTMLVAGASQFINQPPLLAADVEMAAIQSFWPSRTLAGADFTIPSLKQERQQARLIHLATHAQFLRGEPGNSYLQFFDDQLRLNQVAELQWYDPPVELVTLSACQTAMGNVEAELGLAGFAVLAGAKSALASLWKVNDEATAGLMVEFYHQLDQQAIKAEALRQAQLAMIRGEVYTEGDQLVGPSSIQTLPPELAWDEQQELSHPFFWSAFTLVGSPW